MQNHMKGLEDFFAHELQDLYSAEKQIIEAMPRMIEMTENAKLRQGFEKHLKQTQEHKRRIEQICDELGIKLDGMVCQGMKGVLKEGEEILKMEAEPEVKDAAMITAAQRVEHYEMAGYGAARTHAQLLQYEDAAKLLQKTLDEEGMTDHELTKLAEEKINKSAV